MSRPDRFTGRVALVTGAASGIGQATAVAFAREGARVAILDRTADALQPTAEAVRAAGGEGLVLACDIARPEQVEAAIAETTRSDWPTLLAGLDGSPLAPCPVCSDSVLSDAVVPTGGAP